MQKQHRTYGRTDAGRHAWENEKSGLPAAYRKILGLVERLTQADEIIVCMSGDDPEDVLCWLDEMETLGFVECSFSRSSNAGYVPVRREVAWAKAPK
ncbi:MAG TPA: hypothetical protein VG591_10840 [Burkholderiales bacterium]|jgi:hypothetical protein|nr:hypothetical protein [Burkholderiales bacterium]